MFYSYKKTPLILCLIIFSGLAPKALANADYQNHISKIKEERQVRYKQWLSLSSKEEKQAFINQTWKFLQTSITKQLIPPWYGTPWDFNGTSETPGEGKIACGYFVTTILRDAGFLIERNRLAQEPSENLIKSLVEARQIKRFSNVPIDQFVKSIKDWGEGLYVVGLDIHVGFILFEAGEIYFIGPSPRVKTPAF